MEGVGYAIDGDGFAIHGEGLGIDRRPIHEGWDG